MHDIKFIRNNPQEFKLLMEKRELKIKQVELLIQIKNQWH